MGFFWECVVGTLAAVGLICILKSVYDIIVTDYMTAETDAELFLYGNGRDPRTRRLLRAVWQARCHAMPTLEIVFIETGEADERFNYAEAFAEAHPVTYIKY